MRVCLIANQIAAWGKIGGFGTATRAIGAGLARRGIEVSAVVPRRGADGQQPIETLDGITVYGLSSWETLTSGRIFKEIQADIYHSQEPTIGAWLAQRALPEAVHLVTCRDPRGWSDHLLELRYGSLARRLRFPITWWYEMSPLVRESVRRADAVFCPAPCLADRVQRLYGGGVQPQFLPSPIDLPLAEPNKSAEPLVLFVGRWDRRKRIERFFELARSFPDVLFVAVGRAHEAGYDRSLRQTYGRLPNVELPGFINRFDSGELYRWYEQAWVLVNTSAREGLPYTFVEGAAWGCSILSSLNPDGFAQRFGYHAQQDDYEQGLSRLLAGEWRLKGRLAAEHVRLTFSEENSLREHVTHYERLLATDRGTVGPRAKAQSFAPPPNRPWSIPVIVRLALAACLLFAATRSIPWGELLAAAGAVPPAAVVAAMLVSFAARLVESWQMSLAMRRAGLNVGPLRVLMANSLATFYGTFLPGDAAAGLVKWADLSAETGNRPGVLTAIVYNRLMLLVPWIVAAILGIVCFSPWENPWLAPLLIGGGLVCLWLIWFVFRPGVQVRLPERLALVAESLRQFRTFPWTLHAAIGGLSLASMLLTCASAVLLARAAQLGVSIQLVVWTQSVLMLLRLFPLVLQGLGVREATSVGLLGLFGVSPTRAVTFSLLGYFNLAAPTAIGAGWQLYRLLAAAGSTASAPAAIGPAPAAIPGGPGSSR